VQSGLPNSTVAKLLHKYTTPQLREFYVNQNITIKVQPQFGIRLAVSTAEMRLAQKLRYVVFHLEQGATQISLSDYDSDCYDQHCDHLLVTRSITSSSKPQLCVNGEEVVGTYRLLRQSIAMQHQGFYSQTEYDLDPLLRRKSHLSFVELGRSCVLPECRSTAVIELLWQGIWNYVRHFKMDAMFGCASFSGTQLSNHADALNYLAHNVTAPAEWLVRANPEHHVEMKTKPLTEIDQRRALVRLPPLIKAYLRVGAFVGEGAVIDHTFNTTDVFILLPVSNINPRYFSHFGAPTN
jgi:L-ornithine Nalpha-acyltransferase